MDTPISLLSWQCLLFLVPLALGLVFLLGGAIGLSGFDADANVEADADADADADGDHDASADPEPSLWALLGVGKVPLSLLLTTALFVFGGVGIVALRVVVPWLGATWAALFAFIAALVSTPIATGFIARLVVRVVPPNETYAESIDELIGSLGTAELPIGPEPGVACVLDRGGAQIKVRCRTEEAPPIEKGERVLLTDYDPERSVFLVERSPV